MSVEESVTAQGQAFGYHRDPGSKRGTWSNFSGTQRCEPQEYVRARSVEEVCEVVARCTSTGRSVRPVGSSHSIPPLSTTPDVMLDISHLTGVLDVDSANGRATVRGGTLVSALGPQLWDSGVALGNQGGVDVQTIAGAVSTGTHGAGLDFTSMSGAVIGAEIVTASGDLLTIGKDDLRLPAVTTSLGALGVLVKLDLEVVPTYHLSKRLYYQSLDEVLESWWEKSRAHRHYAFWWKPTLPGAEGSQNAPLFGALEDPGNPPPDMKDPCFVRIYDEVEGHVTAADVGADAVDRGYRIFPDTYVDPSWDEFEYHVPYTQCLDALAAVRPIYEAYPDVFPVEFRTIKGEPGMLAPAHGRDSVAIGMCRSLGNPDNDKFFRAIHDTLAEFDARPHWGKGHMMTAQRVSEVFPRYDDFVAIRRDLDPSGTFLNEHLRGLVE